MVPRVTLSLHEDPRFKELLRDLTTEGARVILLGALRSAIEIAKESAQANAPKLTGRMAQSIHVEAPSLARMRSTFVWALLSFGTREQLGIPQDATGFYPSAQEYGWLPAGAAEREGHTDKLTRILSRGGLSRGRNEGRFVTPSLLRAQASKESRAKHFMRDSVLNQQARLVDHVSAKIHEGIVQRYGLRRSG